MHDPTVNDPFAPFGSTWVTAPYSSTVDLFPYRYDSLTSWISEGYYRAGLSLTQRMLFFWINHFGTPMEGDQRSSYQYYELLRSSALGNFPELVKTVALEPMMLIFLNGADNTKESPNENFARELLELFTIGKGPQAGPGDYTTFTEDDVRAFARALTGYVLRYQYSGDPRVQPTVQYVPSRHDAQPKVLSARFGGATILPQGANELSAAIDIIFAQPAVGTYLVRKLYRYFVNYDVTPEVESSVIRPLAVGFGESRFEIIPLLRRLLSSEAFFAPSNRGVLIKSPLEFAVGLYRAFGLELPETDITRRYLLMRRSSWLLYEQRMLPWGAPQRRRLESLLPGTAVQSHLDFGRYTPVSHRRHVELSREWPSYR